MLLKWNVTSGLLFYSSIQALQTKDFQKAKLLQAEIQHEVIETSLEHNQGTQQAIAGVTGCDVLTMVNALIILNLIMCSGSVTYRFSEFPMRNEGEVMRHREMFTNVDIPL